MTSPTIPLLDVQHLSVEFRTRHGLLQAVDDVSFTLARGERLAIVGESGSGKSVMSMALMRMVSHPGRIASGTVLLDGLDLMKVPEQEMRRIRGGEIAMIFQDPMTSLNPVMTVREQLTRPMQQHLGLDPVRARERAVALLTATGIPDPERNVEAYPHELSGGMRQRAMIALAISCEPMLLIADEPTTALDVTVQAQIVQLLKGIAEGSGTAQLPRARFADRDGTRSSVIFVTHDMGLVAQFADRVAVMYGGRIAEIGTVRDIFESPRHPYTQGLLASIPSIEGALPDRLSQIPGTPPNLAELEGGCAFATRCAHVMPRCVSAMPELAEAGPGHAAACWLLANEARDVPQKEATYATG